MFSKLFSWQVVLRSTKILIMAMQMLAEANSELLTVIHVDDRTEVTWSNTSWVASGGSIGPSPGAIVYDDTVTTPQADAIVGYIDFGGDQTQADGGTATISNVEFRLS
jgi:hypothetical protein